MVTLRDLDLFKPPGVAETIDWATALSVLDEKVLTSEVSDKTLGVVLKYQDDILMLVKKKVEAAKTKTKHKKKAEHIIFEDRVKAASNPEVPVPSKIIEERNQILEKPVMNVRISDPVLDCPDISQVNLSNLHKLKKADIFNLLINLGHNVLTLEGNSRWDMSEMLRKEIRRYQIE